jgi:hypothetical protein
MVMSSPTVAWSTMQTQPAYNVVTSRTTLTRPVATVGSHPLRPVARFDVSTQEAPAPQPDKPKKVVWSPDIKAYVRRAFEPDNEIKGVSQKDMEIKLREIISFFAERGMQDTMDWSTHPLPQVLILEERKQVAPTQPVVGYGFQNQTQPYVTPTGGLTNYTTIPYSPSSKRKSQDGEELQSAAADMRKANLQDRVTFGNDSKRHKKNETAASTSKLDQADKEKRKQRFGPNSGTKSIPPRSSPRPDSDSDMSDGPVVGTNQSLEKSYFRLTAPPKAETVRPLPVLERTLAMLIKKWKDESNYNYICNQFKSLRQDLTVQHIKNSFTVKVYESHARIALEKGDLGEYNQCQTQLKALYAQNLGGHPAEFLAYRILYFVYTCNKSDMNDLLAELTPADKSQDAVKHALAVRGSLAIGNYHKFFRLYVQTSNMGAYLIDMFIGRERLQALANISRGYVSPVLVTQACC